MKTIVPFLAALAVLPGCRTQSGPPGAAASGGAASTAVGARPGSESRTARGDEPTGAAREVSRGGGAIDPEARAGGGALSEREAARVWGQFVSAWNSAAGEAEARPGAEASKGSGAPPQGEPLGALGAQAGLITLDNPGAFVRLGLIAKAEDLFALDGEYDLARLKKVRLKAELSPGEAPKPSCEEDLPQKGVFITPASRVRLETLFAALGQYELASAAEIARLKGPVDAALQNAQFAVYDLEQHVGFLFGVEDGRIVLLAIDAVIPCSA